MIEMGISKFNLCLWCVWVKLGLELGFWFQFRDGGESHLIEKKTKKEK